MASRHPYPGPSSVRLTSRLRARILALGADELNRVNLDVPSAISVGTRAARLLRSLAREVERRLPDFSLGVIDDLEVCAVALARAHEICRSPAATSGSDSSVMSELRRVHHRFETELDSLTRRGLLSLPHADRNRGRPSNRKRCNELASLCRLVRARLALVTRKTGITATELTYAEALVDSFRLHYQPTLDSREEHRLLRAKLFTLFVRDYDEIRRAVTYLRWRDADALVPPLHTVRIVVRRAAPRPAISRVHAGPLRSSRR
ncbi:MAG: hypothetical protein QM784_23680 [Polyangiaceae bacterium]